jgi:hypothetical protein
MADGSLLMVFRSLSTDELVFRKNKLLDSITTLSSQTVGGKSFTRDLRLAQNQLEAIVFVMNERSMPCQRERYMVTDFSEMGHAPPAGVTDELNY